VQIDTKGIVECQTGSRVCHLHLYDSAGSLEVNAGPQGSIGFHNQTSLDHQHLYGLVKISGLFAGQAGIKLN